MISRELHVTTIPKKSNSPLLSSQSTTAAAGVVSATTAASTFQRCRSNDDVLLVGVEMV